ncbi:MAG: hypothetical protein P1V51_24250 [Deltaproteobacteria bacterium]|nr:hypothetical protein [Deltaproteobacteria bacterium]
MGYTYFEYRIHKECPECAFPLVVNGPALETRCSSCRARVHLGKEFWSSRFAMSEDGGFFVRGERIGPRPGKKRKKPLCDRCEAPLEVTEVEAGTRGEVTCAGCGAVHLTAPVPEWMRGMKKDGSPPDQLFCVEPEEADESPPEVAPRPIAFACVGCGANLELNLETPRVMTCTYCEVQQFLPGALWHALHPVKRMRSWYVRHGKR